MVKSVLLCSFFGLAQEYKQALVRSSIISTQKFVSRLDYEGARHVLLWVCLSNFDIALHSTSIVWRSTAPSCDRTTQHETLLLLSPVSIPGPFSLLLSPLGAPAASSSNKKSPGGVGGVLVLLLAVGPLGLKPSVTKTPSGRAPNTGPISVLFQKRRGGDIKQSAIGSVSTITDKMQTGSMQRSEKLQKIRSLDFLARSNTAVCKVLYVPVGATLRVAYDILASTQPLTGRPLSPGARSPTRCPASQT